MYLTVCRKGCWDEAHLEDGDNNDAPNFKGPRKKGSGCSANDKIDVETAITPETKKPLNLESDLVERENFFFEGKIFTSLLCCCLFS